jgi:hypothetical protein
MTVSADFVVPLRQDLHRLRGQIAKALGRAIEQPKAWAPSPSPFRQPPAGQANAGLDRLSAAYPNSPQGGGGYGGPQGGGGYGPPR